MLSELILWFSSILTPHAPFFKLISTASPLITPFYPLTNSFPSSRFPSSSSTLCILHAPLVFSWPPSLLFCETSPLHWPKHQISLILFWAAEEMDPATHTGIKSWFPISAEPSAPYSHSEMFQFLIISGKKKKSHTLLCINILLPASLLTDHKQSPSSVSNSYLIFEALMSHSPGCFSINHYEPMYLQSFLSASEPLNCSHLKKDVFASCPFQLPVFTFPSRVKLPKIITNTWSQFLTSFSFTNVSSLTFLPQNCYPRLPSEHFVTQLSG